MKRWYTIVIIFLVGVILIQYCTRPQRKNYTPINPIPAKGITINEHYTPHIAVIKKPGKIIYKPGKVIHDTTYLHQNIDTGAILQRYFEKVVYGDTLQNDSIAYIFVRDTISENRIKSRQKIIKIHPIRFTPSPKIKVYVGFGIGGNLEQFRFAAKALYIDRHERAFGFSYYPINKVYEVSIYWKIHFGKSQKK